MLYKPLLELKKNVNKTKKYIPRLIYLFFQILMEYLLHYASTNNTRNKAAKQLAYISYMHFVNKLSR